ncbi:transposase [Streptomyces bluensis]|uniref:transposase n=1 Tax=Streptomyces bluensis TaxID=33897 RepID=UPI00331BE4FB
MTQEDRLAAAAATVEGQRAVTNLAVLHERLRPCFARREPFDQAGKYLAGLISDLPRKNGWTLAEHPGDATPDRMQRLLNHAVWDHDQAQQVVRGFVVEQMGDQPLRMAALGESGQEKTGQPVTVMTLVRVACLRWPVEEGFEFGRDHFGLDHSQVRLYTALSRHIVLTLAALAVCAVTAASAKTRAPAAPLPTTPDDQPPEDPGLIALTVAEIKRLSPWSPADSCPNPTTCTGFGGDGVI